MSSRGAEIQRRIAELFETRGWPYDLGLSREIALDVEERRLVDDNSLARIVRKHPSVDRTIKSSDVSFAIAGALRDIALADPTSGTEKEVRILFLAAGPEDLARLRLRAEHQDLVLKLQASTYRNQIVVEQLLAIRATDLIDQINRFRPNILHFAGHGNENAIALEDQNGNAVLVNADQLARLVKNARGLQLVVWNSCESHLLAERSALYVPAAIGMADTIRDDVAKAFSVQLYSSLAEGESVDSAFEQAQMAIGFAGLPGDDLPRLFVMSGVSAASVKFV